MGWNGTRSKTNGALLKGDLMKNKRINCLEESAKARFETIHKKSQAMDSSFCQGQKEPQRKGICCLQEGQQAVQRNHASLQGIKKCSIMEKSLLHKGPRWNFCTHQVAFWSVRVSFWFSLPHILYFSMQATLCSLARWLASSC